MRRASAYFVSWIFIGLLSLLLSGCAPSAAEIAARQEHERERIAAQQAAQQALQQDLANREATMKQACAVLYRDPRLLPIQGKMPLGYDDPTFAMRTNTAKPTKREQAAIVALQEDQSQCFEAAFNSNVKNQPPAVIYFFKNEVIDSDKILAELAAASISYTDYFKKQDLYRANVKTALYQQQQQATEQARQNQLAEMEMQTQQNAANTIAGAIYSQIR